MTDAAPPALPGPCVEIPRRKVRVRDPAGGDSVPFETHVVADLDLDGCGSAVVLVPPEKLLVNEAGMFWEIYLERGNCGHFVGLLQGLAEPYALAERHHGLHDFAVTEPAPDPDDEPFGNLEETRYRFDGNQYRAVASEWR